MTSWCVFLNGALLERKVLCLFHFSSAYKSSFFKDLSKAKDKYPDFKYIDILNSQLQLFQLKFTERLENRLSSKTITVKLIWQILFFLIEKTLLRHISSCKLLCKSEHFFSNSMLSLSNFCKHRYFKFPITIISVKIHRETWKQTFK
jgi:hypothetical protein